MVISSVRITVKGMPRITCEGRVRGMVVKGMVRNTVNSTVKGMVTIKFSHVGFSRDNHTDTEKENKSTSIYTLVPCAGRAGPLHNFAGRAGPGPTYCGPGPCLG